tara:strand:- start:335 stop:541 length:207 start_codon:yes stop_codon:yes gene_type:complete
MTIPKETFDYCEQLIRKEIKNTFSSSTFSNEERNITFTSSNATFDELKELYKHLENIQSMKTSYLSGR